MYEKLLKKLKKELQAYDRGEWVNKLGQKRWFPSLFNSAEVDISNTELIRELYKETYMTSLQEAIKFAVLTQPKKSEIPVYDLAKYYEKLDEFIFGDEQREGVYHGLIRKLQAEGLLGEADITDILVAAERLFLDGYRIAKKEGKYVLLKPDLSVYMELFSVESNVVKDDFYFDSLKELLGVKDFNEVDEVGAKALLVFSPLDSKEKLVFRPPSAEYSALMTLSDFLSRHPYKRLVDAKVYKTYSKAEFRESKKKLVAISPRTGTQVNYWRLAIDVAETAILNWFNDEYGFMFVRSYPSVFVVGPDGYVVAKLWIINNRLAEDVLDYYPLPFEQIKNWIETSFNEEYKKQLIRELSDYVLLKLALGKDRIYPSEQKIEPVLRIIYNTRHGKNSLFDERWYKPTEKPKIKDGTSLTLVLSDIIEFAEELLNVGELLGEKAQFFGAKRIALSNEDLISSVDEITITAIPKDVLEEATSFKLIGRQLIDKEFALYDNPLAKVVDSSGLPTYDEDVMAVKNRIALFSVLSKLVSN